MTDTSVAHDEESKRYPLSFTQEWFLYQGARPDRVRTDDSDEGGAFGSRFIQSRAVRITGPVDLAVLQRALDDVVARHETLRTVVVRDADPPYQQVLPPCPVSLEVRNLPPAAGKSRDAEVDELRYRPDPINVREVPLIRARLCKFDDRDSVLYLTVHHSVSDAWSLEVVMRDLGAFYAARAAGTAARLSPVRQYREYAEWQRANATSTAEDGALAYWRDKLRGAREFTIPNDHGHPASYSRPYSLHNHSVEADIVAGASALAAAARTTVFSVLTAGREAEQVHDTMGLFLNCVPFRTDIADCASFRDIVEHTKETFFDAIAHEIPINVIEQTFPDFIKSRDDLSTSLFLLTHAASQLGEDLVYPIAEGAREIVVRWREEDALRDVPSGMVWGVDLPASGALAGGVLFNLDEFDESTVAGWAVALRRILAGAVRDPDQDWKTL
jgi:condensation enzyme